MLSIPSSWCLRKAYATCSVLGNAAQMEVKEVFYAYATRKGTPALRGVSLTMEPGKLLALVGLSGSGKSTLVALLERLYDPDEGQVRASTLSLPLLVPTANTSPALIYHRLSGLCLMRPVCSPLFKWWLPRFSCRKMPGCKLGPVEGVS